MTEFISWTGTEKLRKEQLPCSPPEYPPNKEALYLVPAGTSCLVKSRRGIKWTRIELERDLTFNSSDNEMPDYFEFNHEGATLCVQKNYVIDQGNPVPPGFRHYIVRKSTSCDIRSSQNAEWQKHIQQATAFYPSASEDEQYFYFDLTFRILRVPRQLVLIGKGPVPTPPSR